LEKILSEDVEEEEEIQMKDIDDWFMSTVKDQGGIEEEEFCNNAYEFLSEMHD